MSTLTLAVLSALPVWRKTFQGFPVFTLQQFTEAVHTQINPLAGEAHLKEVRRHLHMMGEVRGHNPTSDTNHSLLNVLASESIDTYM